MNAPITFNDLTLALDDALGILEERLNPDHALLCRLQDLLGAANMQLIDAEPLPTGWIDEYTAADYEGVR